ncbi:MULTISPECIES: hypothetical protein [Nocardiaceae]|uniref:Restriction endonuclease n=1 Tax=Rhodococcoides corynebacterioides TaxID=53972 RepID=A0ABS2KQG6_9NOCA|nr:MULTISPECIES: hypothetical protein [Rhodococcus]MBM7414202.1 hypothetical protein [Rhodococcus corynebacterioides]MBP1116665.1 hypothetical protein [Rhodococcus sp. PvP016]
MADHTINSAGLVNFHKLIVLAGSVEGARPLFEQLVNDVVGVAHPEVRSPTASPGDWGIDAFIGDLDGGTVGVWQAKFYPTKTDVGHQSDIRDSYKSAHRAAGGNGYTLSTWTLAVPSELTPKMMQWWDNWKKRTEKRDNVALDLWDAGRLRRLLMPEQARATREYWFGSHTTHPTLQQSTPDPVLWQDVSNENRYDDFLFVHQLAHANMHETRSAREAFFNAEILEAEVADKAVPREVGALRTWRARIGSTWENKYNSIAADTTGNLLPGLYEHVMDVIDSKHNDHAEGLRAQTLHGQGLMHQQVEAARAGWVRNWREIAEIRDNFAQVSPVEELGTAPTAGELKAIESESKTATERVQ